MAAAEKEGSVGEAGGRVWLVGAGPGDPGLITVKGLRCIAEADVIVYDYLCNPALLDNARPDAEQIYVGKRAGHHAMPQDEINGLICSKALEGKRVCRLKGGDPFVFGRGGEEALELRAKGIPFEVVPGVTSAVAAPAYAGIPVTHRGLSTSVRIITGHEDPTKPESDLDWHEIAATRGTLVFLMGVRNLPAISEKLIAGGTPAETPAALVANGTLHTQRTLVSTLETIAQRAQEEGIAPPAVLVVGEVAALAEQLAWFENKTLFGRSIVVTRARTQASEFAAALEELGADVIQAPVIRVESLAETPEMRAAVRDAGKSDWVIFTSVNGVDAFMAALALEDLDGRAVGAARIAAVGPATAARLREHGLRADLVPDEYVTDALADALDAHGGINGRSFLLPRADIARSDLADALRARGGDVHEITAYRTVQGDALPADLADRLDRGEIDLVAFTSSSTVRNFVDALPPERRERLLGHVVAASIGPVTSATLRDAGVREVVVASESTIPGLTAAIVEYFTSGRGTEP
ncbi:MAG TPA: uroporphyrinogen-III C-methyltransferase [Candidatus Hydrogenedentes bacterium]|nr:uroporphyrinogen-III C-methyltransferase [Candidatus Hydrogenedentota bacterium]